ncbi:MAG: alginate lyase family protein [Burkholderiaceae bacterium]|nr:alginate lyase family protein [Burkholderiaceae bacterium]
MVQISTFWRTVRHLRHEQVLGRLLFVLRRPHPDGRPAPPLRRPTRHWILPARRGASLVGRSRFRLLNEEHELDNVGWDDPRIDRLWRYNLHYFDDLNALGARNRADEQHALVTRWIAENPPGDGTGWEPYPTSLRIVNWIKWFMSGAAVEAEWAQSLATQVRWLCRRLEWHLLGNHLFSNAKALVFAGCFFDGPEAHGWLQRGIAILERELGEQILADGGQYERSPMYHALALEDVLDLLSIASACAPQVERLHALQDVLRQVAPRMLQWLCAMRHPDGTLGRFNDCAEGVAAPAAELERLAREAHVPWEQPARRRLLHLASSGYMRAEYDGAVALLDVAPLGPDYLPGHGHADTLSFELSIGPRRVIVNRGTSCYGTSARRLAERGTALHSTVQIGDGDSSEVWSGFRVGRRARPVGLEWTERSVACSHDGYRHLPGRPSHHRRWIFGKRELQILDRAGDGAHRAVARFHLASGLSLEAIDEDGWLVRDGSSVVARVVVRGGRASTHDTLDATQFGVLLPAKTLAIELNGGAASTQWTW